jgi:hypothetical protein
MPHPPEHKLRWYQYKLGSLFILTTLVALACGWCSNETFRTATAEEAATPNLIVTCHSAFCRVESKQDMRRTSARIARAAVLGEPLENIVNGVKSGILCGNRLENLEGIS